MFSSAAKYGFLMGGSFVLLDTMASPIGWSLFWAAIAVQGAVAARVTWKRTGLRWFTIGMTHGAAVSAAMVPVHLAGYTLRTLPFPWMLIFGCNVALAIAMNVGSRYEDRDKTARWKAVLATTSLTDLLTFRHIPDLR
jgi:hypothetical protein